MATIEKPELNIGFVPLTDSAPLIVAEEMGFFEQEGLQVQLRKQNSWATLRDKLHAGILDAAQMLAPMPIASSLGLGSYEIAVVTPLVLSLNGNAITLSEDLYRELLEVQNLESLTLPLDAGLLAGVVERRKQLGLPKLRFAHVFPYSCHHYQLLDWLKNGGLSVEDVDILTIPPVNMVGFLDNGEIDGFCVGGPWNAKAVRRAIGLTALTSFDIWEDKPEKVLGFTEAFTQQYPNTTQAVARAILLACHWLEGTPNRFEGARLLAMSPYLDASLDEIAPSLLGSCLTHYDMDPRQVQSYNRFNSTPNVEVNRPSESHGYWLIDKMNEAGQLADKTADKVDIKRIFREDLYERISTTSVHSN